MAEGIFYECYCFHIFASVGIIVALLVEDNIQIILSGGDMNFIVPEIERHKRHSEFIFEKLGYFLCELLDIFHEIVILRFVEQF